jgi:hypothetical protein
MTTEINLMKDGRSQTTATAGGAAATGLGNRVARVATKISLLTELSDVLRLGFATAALRGKAVEGHRSPRRWRIQADTRISRSVLECASPVALWAGGAAVDLIQFLQS